MKKKLFIITILAVVLLLTFTGCAGEQKPLRILVDMAYTSYDDNVTRERILYDFEYELKNFDGLENFVFEYIPGSGAERETALDRIRTEIMSGGGPDVFIMNCTGATYSVVQEDALFLMPEKAMEIGLFLPLDDLMENNTQHAEWDKMTQIVLEAGKNEDGQFLIPMTYTVPVAMYLKEELPHTPSKDMTWQDMLADEKLKDVATVLGDGMDPWQEDGEWYWGIDAPVHYILGDLADFENEELLFTEEELKACMDQVFALQQQVKDDGFSLYTREKWYEGYLGVGINCCIWNSEFFTHGMQDTDTFSLVPFYSDDGGATAMVLNYMAINANTHRPENAFKVIDRLMSFNMQQKKPFYLDDLYQTLGAMPMYEDLMQKAYPLDRNSGTHKGTFYSDENYQTVCAVRDSIARARFAGELDMVLFDMMLECNAAVRSGEDYSQIVSSTYTAMKQMMSE